MAERPNNHSPGGAWSAFLGPGLMAHTARQGSRETGGAGVAEVGLMVCMMEVGPVACIGRVWGIAQFHVSGP